ncbi:MAG TPA: tRNA (adenosine(37)-N6)-threonylcarbamoyltransferase complex dimerization subunit type 1 TsaB, partial [Candidatus Omnitrophota bacterium]|nr:tRNA (adenosine(37)-N6)-threonylcarbamoyltransferase complex dimerization subunit type 1 TsaB [Candidatus Omnitrophota bacterium]
MKFLAFDSSSDVLSVGLFDGERRIALSEDPGFARHSSELAPRIEKLLRSKKIRLSELGGIAVGVGPGSFTGLRVGVTAAKVLAFALGKKIAGVSSLEAAARSPRVPDGRVAVHLDARRGRV